MATNFPGALDALRTNQGLIDGSSIVTAAPHNNIMDAVDALQAKVGVNSSAVATSHDYLLAHKGALTSGATVFNTHVTAALTWQNLDLSSIVGARSTFIFLEVLMDRACTFGIKHASFGGADFASHSNSSATGDGAGCATAGANAGSEYRYVFGMTNASGVIQIACDVLAAILTIKLIGYIG